MYAKVSLDFEPNNVEIHSQGSDDTTLRRLRRSEVRTRPHCGKKLKRHSYQISPKRFE